MFAEHEWGIPEPSVMRSGVQGQRIERVTVYPSDYGLAQMAEEAKLGPRAIFAPPKPAAAGAAQQPAPAKESSASDVAESGGDDGLSSDEEAAGLGQGGHAGRDGSGADEGVEVDQERLRLYERSKLRWYYAVVVCAGVPTASHLYRECDGLEFEISASRCAPALTPAQARSMFMHERLRAACGARSGLVNCSGGVMAGIDQGHWQRDIPSRGLHAAAMHGVVRGGCRLGT